MNKKLLLIVSFCCLFLLASASEAYNTSGHWGKNTITMRAAKKSFASGSLWQASLATMVLRFNWNPSNFRIAHKYDDTSVSLGNGESEVWFSPDQAYDPAWTFTWTNTFTGQIVEADVVFYSGEAYTTSMKKTNCWPYGGNSRPFQTTAMHEYGHVAGLGHEKDEYNIMGEDWTHVHCNGSTLSSYVGEDASTGLVSLYGNNSSSDIQDLSLSLFKYKSFDGEYSTHQKCKVYDSSGVELPSTDYNGQKRYDVTKGQIIRVEFTFENNGEATQVPTIAYYISIDNIISHLWDTKIGTRALKLSPEDVLTTFHSITMPSSLISGATYYLGAIIDYDNKIKENDTGNAAYHIIKVK